MTFRTPTAVRVAALCVAAGSFAAGPSTQPVPRAASGPAGASRPVHDDFVALPALPATAAADAIRLDLVDGHLRVRTTLTATTGGIHRVPVPDLHGVCRVLLPAAAPDPPHVGPPATAPAAYEPVAMLFELWQYDRPGESVSTAFVRVTGPSIEIGRVADADAGDWQASVTERPSDIPGRTVAELRVSSPNTGDAVVCTADSFQSLRRLHRPEVARFLEPIFRDLRADAALLAADPALAHQVLAADLPADPIVAAAVAAAVARLDADDFHDRDAAAVALRHLGPAAAGPLSKVDRGTLSPEQRARIDAALADLRPVSAADATRLLDDRDVLLDALLVEGDPPVTRAALARLGRSTTHDVPFDAGLAGDARREAVWSLRQRLASPATRP